MTGITDNEMYRLLLEVQRRHGFRLVRWKNFWKKDLSFSPVVGAGIVVPDRRRKQPKTVYVSTDRYRWEDVEVAHGLLHEMTHLALWHPKEGAKATNEADCVVLEALWAEDILGRGFGREMVESSKDVGVPYIKSRPNMEPPTGATGDVGQWAEPQRTKWWRTERAKLQMLGVVDAQRRPTYKTADWGSVHAL
jgi:hypothetical protein